MRSYPAQKLVSVVLFLTFILSACQKAVTPDPAVTKQTMEAAVVQTLTSAPTITPLPTSTSTPTPTMTPTPVLVSYGPGGFPNNIDPLTGLEVADASILNRRPVMVKVANQAAARPHAGLSNADIVFDYYIGGGLDRFLALFYGKDDPKVGTVRSGRFVDIPLTQMYNGILGMVSADPRELGPILDTLGIRVINTEHCNETTKAICNDGPKTEVSAFANTAEMSKLFASRTNADNLRQNLDGMAFATLPPEGGVPATQFTVHYGKNVDHQWNYDGTTKKYLQTIEGIDSNGEFTGMIPLVDRNTNQQLAFSNVVVVFAELNVLNGKTDTVHKYRFENKDGRALICRDGKVYDVFYSSTWNEPLSFYDADGNPFHLQPGNTWMQLVGLYSTVTEEPTGQWMVRIGLP